MRKVRLSKLASPRGLVGGPFGSSLVSNDYRETGVPVIRGANMGVGRFVGGDFAYVSMEKLENDLGRNTAVARDVVFTQRGTLGQVALVPRSEHEIYVVSQSQMRLRVDPGLASPEFVYYAATSADFLRQIDDRAISTGVPHTNLGILAELEIPALPLAEQQAIAEVLVALDDKIAANTRLAAAADELAMQIFQSLIKPESIPLSSTAQFVNGKAFTKGASGTGRVVVRIAELNSGLSGSTVYSDAEVDGKHVAQRGDILFAWSGSLTLHRWHRDDAIVNQHIFKVIPAPGRPNWLLYEFLRSKLDEFKAIAADKATTMGHIQRRHLDEEVKAPSREEVDRVGPAMQSLWEIALNSESQSLSLAATRDALLPKLMSGQLRVRDAEKIVESAGV